MSERRERTPLEHLERGIMGILLSLLAFLSAYTFHEFDNGLKQVQSDVTEIKISVAELAQHVKDEDNTKFSQNLLPLRLK